MHRKVNRLRGAILLECLVALTMVALFGLPALSLSRAMISALTDAAHEERLASRADRTLAVVALLKRKELDQRLGRHQLGGFTVNVQRPEVGLYRIALADTTAPDVELLVTVVYRPAESAPP